MKDLIVTLKESNSAESKALAGVIESLVRGEYVDEHSIRSAVLGYFDKMQSNCDSVAQGQISISSTICFFRPNLAADLFERPLQCLYYLGVEQMEDINRYLVWFLGFVNLI